MIQDIEPRRLNNQYDAAAVPMPEDSVLLFRGAQVLARMEDALTFPKVRELPEGIPLIYLFAVDDERFFLYEAEPPKELTAVGYALRDLKELREAWAQPKYRLFAACTGKHLADWYRDTRFCGRCGTEMRHSLKERARVCPACRYTAYPRIMPAVIVGVINGDRLLLTRYRTGYNHNALVAGFTEIGETMEQTVAREVMEEAGIRVKNIRYYKSQPWGVANDILAGYYCEVDGDSAIHRDDSELKYAEWTSRADIELQPDESSLTNEMMKRFKQGLPC